jgi:hypothetical protein
MGKSEKMILTVDGRGKRQASKQPQHLADVPLKPRTTLLG